ncbi:MAG: hypothetical protein ABII26_09960, partial [Pseudomonadota bacterium]
MIKFSSDTDKAMKTRSPSAQGHVTGLDSMKSWNDPFFITILFLTLVIPILVLPTILDNAFNTPKTALMLIGVSWMTGLYFFRLFRGSPFYFDNTTLPKVILFLIGLNLFSFFYTWNTYYT